MRPAILATAVLLATAIVAHGADLPEMQAQPYVPPVFCWSGVYAGGNIGGAWAQRNWTDSALGVNFSGGVKSGFIVGGQFGGNFQTGNIVLGAEWDFDYAAGSGNDNGAGVFVPAVGGNLVVTSNHRWISTLTGRVGVAIDRILVYGKAGGGWVGSNSFTITNVATGASVSDSHNMAAGWLVGGGIEWAFGAFINGWTMKLDYAYLGLSNWSYTVPAAAPFLAGDTITATNRNIQTVKLGFNFLFNRPVSSRYY
jgi:outer membrane immunogenic protein